MTELKEILGLAKEYDLWVVVLLYVAILLLRNIKEVIKFVRPHAVDLVSCVQASNEVNDLIDSLLGAIGACRIYIAHYHNGGESLSGVRFLKATKTAERVQVGIEDTPPWTIPLGLISAFVQKLITCDKYCVSDTSLLESVDYTMYMQYKSLGVKSVYLHSLKDVRGVHIGFLAIHYCRHRHLITPDEEQVIKEYCVRLVSLGMAGG